MKRKIRKKQELSPNELDVNEREICGKMCDVKYRCLVLNLRDSMFQSSKIELELAMCLWNLKIMDDVCNICHHIIQVTMGSGLIRLKRNVCVFEHKL